MVQLDFDIMLKLYQFDPVWGIPNPSPFCMRMETYLRMIDHPFEAYTGVQYLSKAPKKKLPYIEDNGQVIADSALIIEYLKAKYGKDLDADMTASDRAIATAFEQMMAESLYWTTFCIRWREHWPLVKQVFFADLPPLIKQILPGRIRRNTLKRFEEQGIGLHSPAEIHQMGIRDLGAIADFLADKPFLMGEQPRGVDAMTYGMLVNILEVPIESPVKQFALGRNNLQAYCDRMKARYYAN